MCSRSGKRKRRSLLKESDRGEKDGEEERNKNGSTLSGREKRERGLI